MIQLKKIEDYPVTYIGSAKDKRDCGDETLLFEAKDTYSVFDVGIMPDTIPGKAKAIIACYVKSAMIAKALGIKTHFIEQVSDTVVRVKKVDTITDRRPTTKDTNFLIPVEWIPRIVTAGSKLRAFQDGTENPVDYGFPPNYMPNEFDYFPYSVEHHTTKFEKVDRNLPLLDEICSIGGITPEEHRRIWNIIWMMTGATRAEMDRAGYTYLDGKLELIIMGPNREIVIGDFHGTPDEDRPIEKTAFKDGRIEHFSKEFIRKIYIDIGYYGKLKAAREAGLPDPPPPPLNEDQIGEISRRYCKFATDYSGVKITF